MMGRTSGSASRTAVNRGDQLREFEKKLQGCAEMDKIRADYNRLRQEAQGRSTS
jgi:hypothetical protein